MSVSENNLAFATVTELTQLLDQRRVSSEELARLAIERLERLGPRYNAVAALLPDRTLAEARRADAERARKRTRGPLHGIPYGAKDLLAARGAPTTWGAPPYRDQVFDQDATAIRRLGRAGAVLAAKLAMVELAGGGGYRYPSASLQGPGKTPWSVQHWSGGSSSGSGAAVAAGLVPYALGSETSGSIITPASYCGITGLRPTYGLISRHGAMPLSWTLDKLGPMARSAEDCALVLEALAGRDHLDPTTARRRFRFVPLDTSQLRAQRLGYAPADFDELADQSARTAFATALDVIKGLNTSFSEAALPEDLPYGTLVSTVLAGEAATIFGDLIESPRLDELVDARQKAGLRSYLSVTARDYLDAMRGRKAVQEAFRVIFGEVDVLVGVGRPGPASEVDRALDRRPSSLNPASTPATPTTAAGRTGNPALIPAGNLAGLPALCLPCGFTPDGLPLAIQLVGRPFSENTLLSLGAWFQSQTDWHRRLPPATN